MTQPIKAGPLPGADIKAAIAAAQKAREFRAAAVQRRMEIGERFKAKQDQIADLYRMPLLRDEVLQLMLDDVDRAAEQFVRSGQLGKIVHQVAYPEGRRPRNHGELGFDHAHLEKHPTAINLQDVVHLQKFPNASLALGGLTGLGAAVNFFTGLPGEAEVDAARACFFFGDRIKEQIERHFDRLCPELVARNVAKQPTPPLSMEQRLAAIAECEHELAALKVEITLLDEQIAELDAATASGTARGNR